MSDPQSQTRPEDAEASQWFARLSTRTVSHDTLEEFRLWRGLPGNAEAYRRIEAVWASAETVSRDPEIEAALSGARARSRPRRTGWRSPGPLVAMAAVPLALAIVVGGVLWLESRSNFVTAVGEERLVQLADGSTVRLDTASRLRVRFNDRRRMVELDQGQAMFTVVDDADRPFVVRAGGTDVTAIGTVFDVRRYNDAVTVTLVTGSVDVATTADMGVGRRLTPGQKARVTDNQTDVRSVDAEAETSWIQGRLIFRDTPLSEAVAEVNRYLTDPIDLDASAINRVPINGVFQTGDREAFVAAATDLFQLQTEETPDGRVRLIPSRKNFQGEL